MGVIFNVEKCERVEMMRNVEERVDFEVGGLNVVGLVVGRGISIVMLGEWKLREDVDVWVWVRVVVVGELWVVGCVECMVGVWRVFVGRDKSSEIGGCEVLMVD